MDELSDMHGLFLAIAVNDVDDTRPVLDYYKRERGETNILETFQAYQAQLGEEEEEWNRQMETQRRSRIGRISPFSLRKKRSPGFPSAVSNWVTQYGLSRFCATV